MEDALATAWRARDFASPAVSLAGGPEDQSPPPPPLLLSRGLSNPLGLSSVPSWCCTSTTAADAAVAGLEVDPMGGASSDTWSVAHSKDGSNVEDGGLDKVTHDSGNNSPAETRRVDDVVSSPSSTPFSFSAPPAGANLRGEAMREAIDVAPHRAGNSLSLIHI